MKRQRAKIKRSHAKQAKLERRRRGRKELWDALWRARGAYELATLRVLDCPVVCERCGLLQDYKIIDWPATENSAIGLFEAMTKITPCPGPFELGCGSLTCVTAEAFQDEDAPRDLELDPRGA